MPRWIRKNIPPATVRVNKLAQPRKRTLLSTFNQNCNHFSIFQVEAIAERIYREQFRSPAQVMNEMKQKLRDKQRRVKYQKNEIRKLQRKIEKCNEYKSLSEKLTKMFRNYMINGRIVDGCDGYDHLTSYTLDHLSKMFKSPRACKDKDNSQIIDQVLREFSNKFASCMCDVLKNTDQPASHVVDDCLERFKQLCIPIDAYYPDPLKADDGGGATEMEETSEDSTDDDSPEDDFKSFDTINEFIADPNKDDSSKALSFINLSKIDVTAEDCAKLAEKADKIQAGIKSGTIKAKASTQNPTTSKTDPKGILSIKKKKKPAKKKKKKKNEKCFGKRDIKPQWDIEWGGKFNGTCSTSEKKE